MEEDEAIALSPAAQRAVGIWLAIAAVGGVSLVVVYVTATLVAGYGWKTRDSEHLDLTKALDTAPLVTKTDEELVVDVPEGHGAFVVLIGTNLTGRDTTTASCSAKDARGNKLEVLSQPSVPTEVAAGPGHVVGLQEQIVVDAAVRPGSARQVRFRCSMFDSGIRTIAGITSDRVVFPKESPALGAAIIAAWVVLGTGLVGLCATILLRRRQPPHAEPS